MKKFILADLTIPCLQVPGSWGNPVTPHLRPWRLPDKRPRKTRVGGHCYSSGQLPLWITCRQSPQDLPVDLLGSLRRWWHSTLISQPEIPLTQSWASDISSEASVHTECMWWVGKAVDMFGGSKKKREKVWEIIFFKGDTQFPVCEMGTIPCSFSLLG